MLAAGSASLPAVEQDEVVVEAALETGEGLSVEVKLEFYFHYLPFVQKVPGYMVDPIDEYCVQQLKEVGGMKLEYEMM